MERLDNCWSDLSYAFESGKMSATDEGKETAARFTALEEKFRAVMDDDFNTAGAIGVLFDGVKMVNTYLRERSTFDPEVLEAAKNFFLKLDSVMGILPPDKETEDFDVAEIEKLIAERNEARKKKDFKRSDEIRDSLAGRGIILEDTPEGAKWKKKT